MSKSSCCGSGIWSFARAILEQRGASEVDLEEHRLEIERLRWRLARLIRGSPNIAA
jgi:hypothetical protein